MLYVCSGVGLVIIAGLCFVEVYRLGFADGQKSASGKEIEVEKPGFKRPKTRAEKIRDKKTDTLLENINNYNGSAIGQKEI